MPPRRVDERVGARGGGRTDPGLVVAAGLDGADGGQDHGEIVAGDGSTGARERVRPVPAEQDGWERHDAEQDRDDAAEQNALHVFQTATQTAPPSEISGCFGRFLRTRRRSRFRFER